MYIGWEQVRVENRKLRFQVIGDTNAKGICGSGVVNVIFDKDNRAKCEKLVTGIIVVDLSKNPITQKALLAFCLKGFIIEKRYSNLIVTLLPRMENFQGKNENAHTMYALNVDICAYGRGISSRTGDR